MSSGIHHHRSRRAGLATRAAILVMAVGAFVAVAAPANAHDQLIGTDPADGARVSALPAQLTLTFNDVVLDDDASSTQLKVTGADGRALTDGAPQVQDNVVTQKLTASSDVTGAVTVLWRVVSQDGHPVSGEYSFTVTGTGSATPSSSGSPSASASESASAGPSPSTTSSTGGGSATPWIVLGALTIAAIAGTAYLVVSRGRRSAPPGEAPEAESEGDADR